MRVSAIIPAAGSGRRLGARLPKLLVPVFGIPLLVHTLRQLKKSFSFSEILLAVQAGHQEKIRHILDSYGLRGVKIVAGGKTRAESVYNAIWEASPACDWILVHDMARPLVRPRLVREILKAARKTGASICGLPATATVKRIDLKKKEVLSTQNRDELFLIQTPQVFRRDRILERYRKLGRKAFLATDEAALFDGTNVKIKVVLGETKNIKITTPDDLRLFQFYLKRKS